MASLKKATGSKTPRDYEEGNSTDGISSDMVDFSKLFDMIYN
jgi:hypothetical protein